MKLNLDDIVFYIFAFHCTKYDIYNNINYIKIKKNKAKKFLFSQNSNTST